MGPHVSPVFVLLLPAMPSNADDEDRLPPICFFQVFTPDGPSLSLGLAEWVSKGVLVDE